MAKLTRKKRIGLFIVVVLAGCMATAVFLIVSRYDYPLAAREYDTALQEYRKAGFPYDNGVFRKEKYWDVDHDAGPVLGEATHFVYQQTPQWVKAFDHRIAKLKHAKDFAGLIEELKAVEEPLNVLSHAAEMRECAYGITYVMELIALDSWLMARAEAKAGLKDGQGALEDLKIGWRLADFAMQGKPNGLGIPGPIGDGALRCATLLQGDSKALRAIVDLIANPPRTELVESFRKGGAYYAQTIADTSIELLERGVSVAPAPPTFWGNVDRKIDELFSPKLRRKAYLTRLLQLCVEANRLIKENQDNLLTLDEKWLQFEKRLTASSGRSWVFLQTFQFFTGFSGVRPYAVPQAKFRAVAACAQALLYKSKTGQYPTQISQIPGNCIDPFSRKPLILRVTDKGVQIYSVGKNGKDDNGKGDDLIAVVG